MSNKALILKNLKTVCADRTEFLNKFLSRFETKRQKMFFLLFFVIALFLVSYSLYWFFYGSRYISTNNAYVDAEISEVHSLTTGTIARIFVTNTQHVKQGELLAELDDSDAKIALKQAEASYLKAKAEADRAELNFKRRKSLANTNLISAEELSDTESEYLIAQAAFQEANASKESAELNYQRTKILAPISGVVAQNEVKLGQRVSSGSKIVWLVPLDNVHINANFKENELKHIKPGQKVTLFSDKYGSGIKFHGTVQGFSGGTGAVFSLIPAQNATGNWVKVVQRLPVRIAVNPEEIKKKPLEVGLSMTVKIDTSS